MMSHDQRRASDVLTAARPNGRGSNKPTTSILGHKRTGSGRIESKENYAGARDIRASPTFSEASSRQSQSPYSPALHPAARDHRNSAPIASLGDLGSPRDTRIPRPKTTAPNLSTTNPRRTPQMQSPSGPSRNVRQPIGLKAAFKLAEEQEARERSGSDEDGTINLRQAFNMANAEANHLALGSPSPAPRSYRRRESEDLRSNQFFGSGGPSMDLGLQLKKFDRNHQLGNAGASGAGAFTTKGRVGPKVAETANTLAEKASNSSLGSSPENRRTSQPNLDPGKQKQPASGMVDWENAGRDSLLPSVEFAPLPPVEFDGDVDLKGSPDAKPSAFSPEKSFNWHLDADFTAGDLQVSNSPRIKLANSSTAFGDPSTSESRRSNDRLKQIKALEIEAANAIISDEEASSIAKRGNSRLDEIRAREMEATSPRALAQSRLDEIRAQNSEARSRSQSPEEARTSSKPGSRSKSASPANDQAEKMTHGSVSPFIDRPSSGTPLSSLRNSYHEPLDGLEKGKDTASQDQPKGLPGDDSYDLLRRLARATSSSPSPNASPKLSGPIAKVEAGSTRTSEERDNSRPLLTRQDRRPRDLGAKSSRDRLTVGFAHLRKEQSSDSLEEKRRSLASSEPDPTARIEAEMKLFALGDNYSEKGSTRAPSPGLSEKSEPIEEQTPRPQRNIVDPLSQPTPRVTGAYVETPMTVKAERDSDWVDLEPDKQTSSSSGVLSGFRRWTGASTGRSEVPQVKREGSNASETMIKASGRSSVPAARRTRSVSRRRRPLVNTAKIPTVKDDLRAILRQHQIDDSTLDDFDGFLLDQDIDHEELEKIVDDTVTKLEEDLNVPGLTDHERELQAYDRMSKTLKTGLLGIRSAKQGIERLEDKVAHSEKKDPLIPVLADLGLSSSSPIPLFHPQLGDSTTHIYVPPLYRRHPFRFTPLGLLTLILSIWYTVECIFCSLYVDPYDCADPKLPCDWSPNEPYYPYAAPFMLDEWITGGKGRALAWRVGEDLGDIVSEVVDWATGHDFTQEDELYMDVWQRKRHRRRLKKWGLVRTWIEPIEFRDKFRAWREAWSVRQRALETGEPVWGDESMSADERL
ncbi:hypothetical protein JX265_010266 [Neoarthrinium moseri]|uniref:Uncharacterized protein n=1 Tax=Neoarthrinium moseri TaxID=1658444 RepID=A0A9Q0AKW0_9PEZI|nr:hypothetical protein JX265_010266 [Neoarthrinium moseri]